MMTLAEMSVAAKKYFEIQPSAVVAARQDLSREGYELLFDSCAQTPSDGVRNSVVAARQLLFRIGSVFVDVEVGRETDSNQASLTGQMLDSSNPGHPPVGVPVALLDRGRRVASTSSNDHGEFRMRFAVKNNLKLSVTFDRQRPVHLPIISPPGKKGRNTGRVKKYQPLGSVEDRTLEL